MEFERVLLSLVRLFLFVVNDRINRGCRRRSIYSPVENAGDESGLQRYLPLSPLVHEIHLQDC